MTKSSTQRGGLGPPRCSFCPSKLVPVHDWETKLVGGHDWERKARESKVESRPQESVACLLGGGFAATPCYHPPVIVTAEQDIAGAEIAAACVVQVHERLAEALRPGQTLAQIDAFVASTLQELHCKSAFLNYTVREHPPFPSHACLSVNECIVHGTHDMNSDPLEPGDVISIDIGVTHNGWIGDAAWTYAISEASDQVIALMRAGRESLRLGVEAMQAGRPLIDWARAVQKHAEGECGFGLVRGLGGHGYGRTLHGPPYISNVVPTFPGEWPEAFKAFKPGMLIAVEPMLALTTTEIRSSGRAWPIYSADDSLAVHYEADVRITPDGPHNLTAGLFDLPEIVGQG